MNRYTVYLEGRCYPIFANDFKIDQSGIVFLDENGRICGFAPLTSVIAME